MSKNVRDQFFAWVNDRGCDTDGAWSAWQAAWDAALEAAAKACEVRADDVRKANTYRGRIGAAPTFVADQLEFSASAIRSMKGSTQ